MHQPTIIAAFTIGLLACKTHEDSTPPPGEDSAQAESPEAQEEIETPKDVMRDPDYGERVTLEGKVDLVYFPNVFTMKAGVFNDELLVVAPKDLVIDALVAPNKVRVTGTIEQMVVAEAEREYSFDFDEAMEVEWEERPYLVAESLEILPD